MKRSKVKYFIYITVVALFLFISTCIILELRKKRAIDKNLQTLASFCMTNIFGVKFCTESIPDQPILILYINPDCEMCEVEISQLKSQINKFKGTSILIITNAPVNQATNFYKTHRLSEISNLQFLLDEGMEFQDHTGVSVVPTCLIYNKDKKLVHKFAGEVKVDILLKYIAHQ